MDLLLVTYALKHRYCVAVLNQRRQFSRSCVVLYKIIFLTALHDSENKLQKVCIIHKGSIFQEGGPIGLVQSGDVITIDVSKRVIDVDLTEQQLEERRRKWTPLPYKSTYGALWKVL